MSLAKVLQAFESKDQPEAIYRAVDAALAATPGFRLFTILVCHNEKRLVQRVYTNNPASYPVGGTKPMSSSPWSDRVMKDGAVYIGRTREDIKAAFFDYELIWSLGCESVINVPIRWRGETLGTFNLLHQAGYYTEQHEEAVRLMAQLAIPAVNTSIERITK
jgi:transcriptional regulator with GAF, ATPase, and Fis domain